MVTTFKEGMKDTDLIENEQRWFTKRLRGLKRFILCRTLTSLSLELWRLHLDLIFCCEINDCCAISIETADHPPLTYW